MSTNSALPPLHFPAKHRAVRVSASAGPPPRSNTRAKQMQQAFNNAQPQLYGNPRTGAATGSATGSATGDGCVRAPYDEWYVSRSECLQQLPDGYQCNPRYINGVWDRYTPYARDTTDCGGPMPADLLPQVLGATSLVDTEIAEYINDVQLSLGYGGNVGELSFSYNDQTNENMPVTMTWNESDNVNDTLFNPVEYVYAVPYGTGIARLTINTINGRATARFPFAGYLAKLVFQITNIQNWQQAPNTSTTNQPRGSARTSTASRMCRGQIG